MNGEPKLQEQSRVRPPEPASRRKPSNRNMTLEPGWATLNQRRREDTKLNPEGEAVVLARWVAGMGEAPQTSALDAPTNETLAELAVVKQVGGQPGGRFPLEHSEPGCTVGFSDGRAGAEHDGNIPEQALAQRSRQNGRGADRTGAKNLAGPRVLIQAQLAEKGRSRALTTGVKAPLLTVPP